MSINIEIREMRLLLILRFSVIKEYVNELIIIKVYR